MASGLSLTETAFWIRRLIYGSILLLVAVIVVRVGLNIQKQRQFEHGLRGLPAEKANIAFGMLPRLRFTEAKSSRPMNFELQTVTGTIPATPPIAKVFLMPKPVGITFFSLEKGKKFASQLGFNDEPKEVSVGQYRWVQEVVLTEGSGERAERSLALDVVSGHFQLTYDLKSDPGLAKGTLPDQKLAVNQAIEYLRRLNLYTNEFANGENRVSYLKLDGGQPVSTSSQTDAHLIEVSFFRQGVKGALLGAGATPDLITPVTQPVFNQALVKVTASSAPEPERKYVAVEYVFWPVDYSGYATYPLKTGLEAYEELVGGGGAVLSEVNQTKAVIRRVRLAYYEPAEHQDFFQPVFIFEGDYNFVAYVPAIANALIENGGSTSSQE